MSVLNFFFVSSEFTSATRVRDDLKRISGCGRIRVEIFHIRKKRNHKKIHTSQNSSPIRQEIATKAAIIAGSLSHRTRYVFGIVEVICIDIFTIASVNLNLNLNHKDST